MASLHRNRSSKEGFYWIDFRYHGKRFRRSTGTTDRKIAQQILDDLRGKIARGKFQLDEVEEKNRSLEEFTTEYVEFGKVTKPASVFLDKRALEELRDFLGKSRPLRMITETQARQFVAHLMNKPLMTGARKPGVYRSDKKGLAPHTINRYMLAIRTAFNWAMVGDRRYVGENVFKTVKPFKVEETVRAITQDELVGLLDVVQKDGARGEDFLRYLLFCLNTGCRRSEALNIMWQDIDFVRGIIQFRKTKARKQRGVPINDELKAVLVRLLAEKKVQEMKVGPTDRLFEYSKDGATSRFAKYRDRAGLSKDVHLHCTRHTTAAFLADYGVDIKDVKDVLGHSKMEMTERYRHIHPLHLRAAVQNLGFMNLLSEHNEVTEAKKKQDESGSNLTSQ